jgi:hypothetical protein
MSKISELSDGGVIQGGDTLIAVRSGGNVKVTYGGSTTANIDGGTIDGTVIGGSTAAAGSFTTGQFNTSVNVDGTVTVDVADGVEPMRIDTNTSTSVDAITFLGNQDQEATIKFHREGTTRTGIGLATSVAGVTTEALRVTSDLNVGIGTSSPDFKLQVEAASDPTIASTDTTNGVTTVINSSNSAGAVGTSTDHPLVIVTNGSERMRIDSSGNLLVGTTSPIVATNNTANGFTFSPASGYAWLSVSDSGGVFVQRQNDNSVFTFLRANATVGSISVTASTTSYNTSSDERLKENITDANDAGDKIDAIKVRQYDWKADGSHQDYGMVAQELMTVAPEAVSGDPESDEMMGVDYSKLVPMLIKEIQSLRARVAQLEGAN